MAPNQRVNHFRNHIEVSNFFLRKITKNPNFFFKKITVDKKGYDGKELKTT